MRKLITSFVILSFGICLFAADLETIIQSAMDSSQTIKTLNINRQNTELSWQSQDLEEERVSITLSTGSITVQGEASGSPVFSMGPSADVTLPETDNGTVISFGLDNTTKIYTSGSSSLTLTPYADLTRTISIDSYTDTREEITKLKNRVQQNMNYQKSLLQFRSSVIESIISILKAEMSLSSSQLSYDRALADYTNDIASGSIMEGSLKDLQAQMKLESQKVTLDNQKAKLQTLLDSFKQSFGIDYEMPEDIREADLTLEVKAEGNTSVLVSGYDLELAKQELSVATGTSKSLVLGASADAPFTYSGTSTSDIWTSGIEGSMSASITASNYSIGAKAGASYEYSFDSSTGEFVPYITITGKWTNETSSKADELEVQTLQNKVILAQMEYDDALESYRSDASDIEQEIADLEVEMSQFEISAKYNTLILEHTLQLYEAGLSTQRDVEDAQNDVDNDGIQRIIYALQELLIENDIAMLQL